MAKLLGTILLPLVLPLVLAAPQTIRVRVEPVMAGVEVFLVEGATTRSRVTPVDGIASFGGLRSGTRYGAWARAPGHQSRLVRDLVASPAGVTGVDAILSLSPVRPVRVRTSPGARVSYDGRTFLTDSFSLPAGLHAFVVEHDEFVRSAPQAMRLDGDDETAATRDVVLDPGLTLLGRVVDGAGQPVSGAHVRLHVDRRLNVRRVTTDRDGRFALGGFRGEQISVEVTALHRAAAMHRVLFFPDELRARVEIALSQASAVVLPVSGSRFAEAILLPEWYETAADTRVLASHHDPVRRRGGRSFRFSALTPGKRYRVLVTAPGMRPAASPGFVAPAAGEAISLPAVALQPAASIRGTGAHPGALVACRDPSGGVTRTRADRGGAFSFDQLGAGEHRVQDLATGVEREIALRVGEEMTASLADSGSSAASSPKEDAKNRYHGLVLDASFDPVGGVSVQVLGQSATSAADGSFSLDLGRARLAKVRAGLRPTWPSRALLEDAHLPHVEWVRSLDEPARVVLHRAGVLRLGFEPKLPARSWLDYRDARGLTGRIPLVSGAVEVSVPELAVGACELRLRAPGYAWWEGRVAIERAGKDADPTPVRLAPGRTVRGRLLVRDFRDRLAVTAPCDRGWVSWLERPDVWTPVEADGSFSLEGLPADRVRLVAVAPGRAWEVRELNLAASGAEGVEFALTRSETLVLHVVDESGRGIDGARFDLLNRWGFSARRMLHRYRFRGVIADDEDRVELQQSRVEKVGPGRYQFRGLAVGSYRVRVRCTGYETAEAKAQVVSALSRKELSDLAKEVFDLTVRVSMRKRPAER